MGRVLGATLIGFSFSQPTMHVGDQLSQDTSKYMSFQRLLPYKHARQSMQVLNVHLTLDTNSVASF